MSKPRKYTSWIADYTLETWKKLLLWHALRVVFGKNPVNTFASNCLAKSWSSYCTTIHWSPKSWKRKLPMSMTDRSVWAASLLQSESLKFHSPCGLHPLQGFHARQRHGTGCPTKPLWHCRKAALHPQQPVTKIENWKPQILQMEIQSVWRNEADTLQFLEKDPIQKCLGRLKNHWRSTYMRFSSICKPITILTTTPHSAICRRMTWCKAQKEQWAAARYKTVF